MRKQRTISHPVVFKGVGIHSGQESVLTVKPAQPNTGITFIRDTEHGQAVIPYRADLVTDTQNQIALGLSGATIKTVEHLTAALYALQIDNAEIESTGVEIPILDGSSRAFFDAFNQAGSVEQTEDRQEFRVMQPIWVTDGDKFTIALPYDGLKVHYTIDFENSPIGTQVFQSDINADTFSQELKRARTFGFIEDLDHYQSMGLSKGVTMENVQVFSRSEQKMLNAPRYQDEPVRHKMLDLIGGIAILPFDLKAFIITYKGGHKLDIQFANKVLAVKSAAERLHFLRHPNNQAAFPAHVAEWLEQSGIHA